MKKENDESHTIIPDCSFDQLKRNYTQIKQNTRNSTLLKIDDFFRNINEYGFLPTHFSKKLVLIAGRTIWNNLKNKDRIPSVYLPNTREGEQTIKKSIEALDDCITYVTPKYDICYEEILIKTIAVDTIIVCNTDLAALSQIIQDQSKHRFNLIILSNESEVPKINNMTLWNWYREEIDLLESKTSNNIDVSNIQDNELNVLIQHFEDCIEYISTLEIPIKLKTYGYFLRLALNAVQEDQFEYLSMRLKRNKELEQNEGGYENFSDKNPKEALESLILYLKNNNPKQAKLKQIISNTQENSIIVADREDAEFFKIITQKSNRCTIITNAELKKLPKNGKTNNKTIIFYSFNGSKDFNYMYNLPNSLRVVLYKQEEQLYLNQLQVYKKHLETELSSEDRFALCGIKYELVVEPEIKISPTLEQTIERLEQCSNTVYDGYKNESDSLLDDLEEEIIYRITFDNDVHVEIESNETVFDKKGNLIKSYRLKVSDKVRIYPKEKLAENLFQIAVDVETDKFEKIDEHSEFWRNALKSLDIKHGREKLYSLLKQNGLRVKRLTVDSYFRGNRKFPMYNNDLKAILALSDNETMFNDIKKSKRLYNSTMIVLGRNLKQELQQFLNNKTVGEILRKKNFTADALQQFIDEYMPLLTITKIEEASDEQ